MGLTWTAGLSTSVTEANKTRSRATAGPCLPALTLRETDSQCKPFSRSVLGSNNLSPTVAEQISLPPSGCMLTAPRAGGNRPVILGSVTTGKPTSLVIYFQFIHGAHGDAGVQLHLSINLPPIRDGDSIPERSFKTRKQFNLRRACVSGRSSAVTELLNGTVLRDGTCSVGSNSPEVTFLQRSRERRQ